MFRPEHALVVESPAPWNWGRETMHSYREFYLGLLRPLFWRRPREQFVCVAARVGKIALLRPSPGMNGVLLCSHTHRHAQWSLNCRGSTGSAVSGTYLLGR